MEKLDSWIDGQGVVTETQLDPLTNRFVIQKKQDITANIEYATALRNSEEYTRQGIKKGMWHVAHIPAMEIERLLKIGVNVYTASAKDIVSGLKKIGSDHLITTRGRV